MDTIALFGGSFDPPHIGHEAIVKALQKFKNVDKIIILPTFLNPFKSKSFASAINRLNCLRTRFHGFDRVEISDYEIIQGQKVPSIQSVKHFLKLYKHIYLVIGADNLACLNKWQSYDELKDLVTFIVATRDDIDIPKEYISLNINEDISSTLIREKDKQSKF
ncbi:MAG: nicotinate-nicotinamide nucleotide adenylyltransferase [Sulfurimonas sp.]|nr:MAG: nicotinate-nicotinamide nucleotide adenylyltransferase [Sulfurimonas sp.]